MQHIETVIVGSGQAGLATSYYLSQHGREHIVLEQAALAGNVWRNERWDSFTLVTPNWTLRMPGAEYSGVNREGFMPRDEVVAYFEQYVRRFQLPVQYNTRVMSVEPSDPAGFRVKTNEGIYAARNVVMATGWDQLPRIAPSAADLSPDITQLHSSRYRNPECLPAGGVLVVGSAMSGCQIAEELYQHGRQVFLCTSRAGRMPRRYRGRDAYEWLHLTGFFDLTPDKLPFPKEHFVAPHVSGKDGGHTLNLHQFARDGVNLLGHLRGGTGDKVWLAPDLHENLAGADRFELQIANMIDRCIRARGINAPAEELPQLHDGYEQPIVEELDLRAANIRTLIWATGYTFDFNLVKLNIFEKDGFPIQKSGVTSVPGLYFVGLHWAPSLKPGMLAGVAESARHIASSIVDQRSPVNGGSDLLIPHASDLIPTLASTL